MVDLMWQRFGMLTVIGRADRPPHVKDRSLWWVCKCDCGNTISTSGLYLKQGNKKSCGCIKATNGGRNKLSVARDVSCSEMYHMRDQGMSNRDIAEKLDCSISTVYGMIGKQPKGIRAKQKSNFQPSFAPAVKTEAEEVRKSFRERCEEVLAPPQGSDGNRNGCEIQGRCAKQVGRAGASVRRGYGQMLSSLRRISDRHEGWNASPDMRGMP